MPSQKKPAGEDIEAIIAGASPAETTVTLCLAGALQGEYEALDQQLRDAAALVGQSLAGGPGVDIARRMEEIRAEMAQHMRPFRFRAIAPKAWSDLLAEHPGTTPAQAFDPDTLGPAAIAACAIQPAMTIEQYERLAERLTYGQQDALLSAVWDLNTKAARSIPFSLLASATAGDRTGEK